jgi:Asp/Glu/hydantoin racemase
MADPAAVTEALALACEAAIRIDGAQALVIGGGPLALAARALRPRFVVPIIEPIPAAVRLAQKRL